MNCDLFFVLVLVYSFLATVQDYTHANLPVELLLFCVILIFSCVILAASVSRVNQRLVVSF
jgi:hypothetical protein